MDGDALYQRLAAMRDELDEILRRIEFPAPEEDADEGDFDADAIGEFVVDETSVKIEKGPLPHVDCENRDCHDPHVWNGIEADGETTIEYWCAGMPF